MLAMCAENCARRRSATAQAFGAGVHTSYQYSGQLPSVGPKQSSSGYSIELAGAREKVRSTTAEATPALERGADSRAVAAHSHHHMMRMLASEQQQLPSAKHYKGESRPSRVDPAAQV